MEVFRRAPLLYRGAGGRKRGGDLVVHQGGQPARAGRRSRRPGDLLAQARRSRASSEDAFDMP